MAKCHWVELTPLWGRTLFLACAYGHCEIVALLLEKGFPQDLVHYGEYSAASIVSACQRGHRGVVKLLLEKGTDVDSAIDFKHHSFNLLNECDWLSIMPEDVPAMPELALVAAASHGHTEVVGLLLDQGAHVGLHIAVTSAIRGRFREVVKIFIERYSEKELLDSDGCSPLMSAIRYRCHGIAKFLLEKGAEVNLQDCSDISPLMIVSGKIEHDDKYDVYGGDYGYEDDLYEYYCDYEDNYDYEDDCEYGYDYDYGCGTYLGFQYSVAELLLERLARIDLQDENGMSALMFASSQGLFDMAKMLLGKGAQSDLQDNNGMSALMFASSQGLFDMAKMLLGKGAQIDLQDKSSGRSAVMIANECQYWNVGKLLIEKGAEIDTTILSAFMSSLMTEYQNCMEPLEDSLNATQAKYLEEAALLIEKDAVIDLGNEKACKLLLWFACVCGDFYITQFILEASPWVEDSELWCRALYLACSHGHCEIVTLLGFHRT